MEQYSLGLRKYFKGKLKDASIKFFNAGKHYLSKGDMENARASFYEAGRIIYEYAENLRWKGEKIFKLAKNYLLSALYFELAHSKNKVREIIDLLDEARYLYGDGKITIDLNALRIFIQAIDGYHVESLLDQIDEFSREWSILKEKQRKKFYGAYVLLQIAKNLLLNKKEIAKFIWRNNNIHVRELYSSIASQIELLIKKSLGI